MEVGEEEGGAPPFFFSLFYPIGYGRGEEGGRGRWQRHNGTTPVSSINLDRPRGRRHHWERGGSRSSTSRETQSSVTHAQKKTHEKKKKKKRKNYENGRRVKRRPVAHPSRKSFSFFFFFWSSRRTHQRRAGWKLFQKKKNGQKPISYFFTRPFSCKKIREPVPIQSVECRKKLSVPKSAECEGKSPGGAEYLRETFQEENQKENPKSVQQFACRLPAAQRSLVLVSVVL